MQLKSYQSILQVFRRVHRHEHLVPFWIHVPTCTWSALSGIPNEFRNKHFLLLPLSLQDYLLAHFFHQVLGFIPVMWDLFKVDMALTWSLFVTVALEWELTLWPQHRGIPHWKQTVIELLALRPTVTQCACYPVNATNSPTAKWSATRVSPCCTTAQLKGEKGQETEKSVTIPVNFNGGIVYIFIYKKELTAEKKITLGF